VCITDNSGEETVVMLLDDLGLDHGDIVGIYTRLLKQGVKDIAKINGQAIGAVQGNRKVLAAQQSQSQSQSQSLQSAQRKGRSPKGSLGVSAATMGRNADQGAPPPPSLAESASPGVKMLTAKVKAEMKARGSGGFIGLQRRFKIMDDDGSKTLSLQGSLMCDFSTTCRLIFLFSHLTIVSSDFIVLATTVDHSLFVYLSPFSHPNTSHTNTHTQHTHTTHTHTHTHTQRVQEGDEGAQSQHDRQGHLRALCPLRFRQRRIHRL
jgi:hypothetical protein